MNGQEMMPQKRGEPAKRSNGRDFQNSTKTEYHLEWNWCGRSCQEPTVLRNLQEVGRGGGVIRFALNRRRGELEGYELQFRVPLPARSQHHTQFKSLFMKLRFLVSYMGE